MGKPYLEITDSYGNKYWVKIKQLRSKPPISKFSFFDGFTWGMAAAAALFLVCDRIF